MISANGCEVDIEVQGSTNSVELARRLDAIAYPGLTGNFDVAKSAALPRRRVPSGIVRYDLN